MTVYLKLTTKKWVDGDYTTTTANGLSGFIYSNEAMTIPVDWSGAGYTTKEIRFIDNGIEYDNDTSNLTLNSNGSFTYVPPNGKLNTVGLYEVQIHVKSSTEELSTVGIDDSNVIMVEPSG